MQQQKSFVLVSVLLITTIATLLALSQLSMNLLQVRIAVNQHKEISARLAAERGIFDAFKVIKTGTSSSAIMTELNRLSATNENKYTLQNILWSGSETESTFSFVSKGTNHNAIAYLKTEIKLKSSGVFDSAILACESVVVWGSAKIDSFKGQSYAAATPGFNGNVKVIDGVIRLPAGHAPPNNNKGIFGNLTAKQIDGNKNVIQGKGDDIEGYQGDSSECDPLGIVDVMAGIKNKVGIARTNFDSDNDFTDGNLYFYDNLDIQNDDILITGNVTLYITGDMTTKNTTFTLANDTSSLTIYIEGQISVETGSNIFENKYARPGLIPLTLYSSNNSDDAVALKGNADVYMNLYAPLGNVHYTGSGDIMGALHGKAIDISGNGDIHYDEGLTGIGHSGTSSVSYSTIYYYYPSE